MYQSIRQLMQHLRKDQYYQLEYSRIKYINGSSLKINFPSYNNVHIYISFFLIFPNLTKDVSSKVKIQFVVTKSIENPEEKKSIQESIEVEKKDGDKENYESREACSSLPAGKWVGYMCSHGNGKGNRCERWLFRDETIVSYKRAGGKGQPATDDINLRQCKRPRLRISLPFRSSPGVELRSALSNDPIVILIRPRDLSLPSSVSGSPYLLREEAKLLALFPRSAESLSRLWIRFVIIFLCLLDTQGWIVSSFLPCVFSYDDLNSFRIFFFNEI